MLSRKEMLARAANQKRESKWVDFKEEFDTGSNRDWCEIIKDIVAMANSGEGLILVGVRNNGTPSGYDVSSVLDLDLAQLTDKIARYTGRQFSEIEITEAVRGGRRIAALLIQGIDIPMVFIRPGTYDIGGGRQRSAFGRGVVYFRHGAKSEPGNSDDLRKVIDRNLERIRKDWLGNIRKVVRAPLGHTVQILPPDVRVSAEGAAMPVRIVDEPDAPAYRLETPDTTHPYRQKDVIRLVNERLGRQKIINSHDCLCVRRLHSINETKPQYCHNPKFGSPQYSEAFVDWMVTSFEEDPSFFEKARQEYRVLRSRA